MIYSKNISKNELLFINDFNFGLFKISTNSDDKPTINSIKDFIHKLKGSILSHFGRKVEGEFQQLEPFVGEKYDNYFNHWTFDTMSRKYKGNLTS